MPLFKSRLLMTGLAVAGVASAVAIGFAAPHLGRGPLTGEKQPGLEASEAVIGPTLVAEKQKDTAQPKAQPPQGGSGREVNVDAPSANVNVDKESGRVRVTAPHTDVRVDPDKGRVQVRAPYVNLDIRW
jgi:hypothetical protein